MTTYQIRYRRKDYILADAFRPQPGWGYKGYTVDSDKLECDDIKAIYDAAINSPPNDQYGLFSVRALPYCDENPIMYGPEADKLKGLTWPAKPQPSQHNESE